jgi:hypothetical protein
MSGTDVLDLGLGCVPWDSTGKHGGAGLCWVDLSRGPEAHPPPDSHPSTTHKGLALLR